ncbi:MAG TPA: hypothetical protein VNK95_13420, partial [Caldilineaceae bacterium]|nr:hypothetical protein [Caldilineaceae bacterium]
LLYLAFPYRLYDLWVRGALPAFAAFLWPPLLLLFAIRLLRRPPGPHRRAWRSPDALGLALSWAGLALTHNLTALMAATLAVAALPLIALPGANHLGRAYRQRLGQTLIRLGWPALWGGLLSAFYVLPALLEARWVGIGATAGVGSYTAHFAGWAELAQGGLHYRYPAASAPTVPLPVYTLPLLALAALALFRPPARPARRRGPLLLALAAALATLWLTTRSSAPLWAVAAPVLGKLQFPWRWQTLLALALAALLALVMEQAFASRPPYRASRWAAWGAAAALGLLAFGYAGDLPAGDAAPQVTVAAMWAFDAAQGQVGASWTGEFLPRWVKAPRWTIGRAPDEAGETPPPLPSAALSARPLAAGYLDAAYVVEAARPLTLTLDRFYFPAWSVQVDGAPAATAPTGDLGLLSLPLAAGEHRVTVAWRATPALWMGRAATLLGWALAGLALLELSPPRRRWALGSWLAVGLIALAGIAGVSERSVAPTPLAADFGPVRLEGAVLPPARAGAAAPIDLYWTVAASPPDLVAFVHLLGPDGAVIAQWDEPLGTSYRPPSRLLPGLLMRHTLWLPLPDTLAPGEYPVVAGLYPAGQADAPLVAQDAATARLPLGALRVSR